VRRSAPSEAVGGDLVAATRTQIESRLEELRPLVAEVARLERALAALETIERPSTPRAPTRPGRRRRRGRPPGRRSSGTRADQFLALVLDRPGITIAEAAKATGAAPTYLYRIAATLEREGTVRRERRGFVAPGVEGPTAPEPRGEGPPPTGVAIPLPEPRT
jgi:hypothetical protein